MLRMKVDNKDKDEPEEDELHDEDNQCLFLDKRVSFKKFLLAFFCSLLDESLYNNLKITCPLNSSGFK